MKYQFISTKVSWRNIPEDSNLLDHVAVQDSGSNPESGTLG
jgi:hypothetical protein